MLTDNDVRWQQALDELEAHLNEVARALDSDEAPPTVTWQPPGDLGLPPEPLRPRAQAVAQRMAHLQRRAAARAEELREELTGVDQRRQAGAIYAARIAP